MFDLRTYPGLEKAAPCLRPDALDSSSPGWPSSTPSSVSACWRSVASRFSSSTAIGIRSSRSKKNSAEFVARYRAAGAADAVTLIVPKARGTTSGRVSSTAGSSSISPSSATREGCASVAEHDAVRGKGPRVGRDRRPFATKPGSCGGIRVPCIGSPGGGRFL